MNKMENNDAVLITRMGTTGVGLLVARSKDVFD